MYNDFATSHKFFMLVDFVLPKRSPNIELELLRRVILQIDKCF